MSIHDTLNERHNTHGEYTDQALMTETITDTFESGANWSKLRATHEHALKMIAVKIGRILTGDPEYADHWRDIAGYATLVADLIERTNKTAFQPIPPPAPPKPSDFATWKQEQQEKLIAAARDYREIMKGGNP